jgi:hypothetical protein
VGEDPVADELAEELAEPLVAQPDSGAEDVTRRDPACVVERPEKALADIEWAGVVVAFASELEAGAAGVVGGEEQIERIGRGGGAVLDRDGELVLGATHVEGAVGPGVKIAGAAEALPSLGARGAILAGVVDDENGDVVLALHLTQKGEEGGDIAGAVFVNAMKSDERVEQEQARSNRTEGASEARAIAVEIEAKRRGGDDLEGEGTDIQLAVAAESQETLLHGLGAILGEVEENGPGIVDGEATEARSRGSDGEGEIECQPALATLGCAANDSHTGASPEGFDEPAAVGSEIGEEGGADGGQEGRVVHASHALP